MVQLGWLLLGAGRGCRPPAADQENQCAQKPLLPSPNRNSPQWSIRPPFTMQSRGLELGYLRECPPASRVAEQASALTEAQAYVFGALSPKYFLFNSMDKVFGGSFSRET